MIEWALYVSMAIAIRGEPGWISVEPDGRRIFAEARGCVAAGKRFAGSHTKVKCVPQLKFGATYTPSPLPKTIEVKP